MVNLIQQVQQCPHSQLSYQDGSFKITLHVRSQVQVAMLANSLTQLGCEDVSIDSTLAPIEQSISFRVADRKLRNCLMDATHGSFHF